jgi:hypothetical protein
MRKKNNLFLMFLLGTTTILFSQTKIEKSIKDSLKIEKSKSKVLPDKVAHAEPLYLDLIRDLGARKGEREWNVGTQIADAPGYNIYSGFVEYEWAVVNRLGLEIEIPFTFYSPNNKFSSTPKNTINSIQLAIQYSFYVSKKHQTTLAIAYLHEFELPAFKEYGKTTMFTGQIYNPFFVAAKRWGPSFHTLLYTGPVIQHTFENNKIETLWQINTSFHYMIPRTSNFIGLELNNEVKEGNFEITIRPQMRVKITDNLLIGIVTGIPINRKSERISSLLRFIYVLKSKYRSIPNPSAHL